MQLTLVTLLCLGVALASGAVLPLGKHLVNPSSPQHFALVLPLTEEDAYRLAIGDISHFDIINNLEPHQPQSLTRVRRQLSGGVDHTNTDGTTIHGKATTNLYTSENGKHTVDGNVHAQRTFNNPNYGTGPLIYGGGVSYTHPRGSADLNVDRTPMGTQLNARGSGTVWQSNDGNRRVDAYGSYGRSYGGMYGTGRPSYGVGATYTMRFKK